MRRRSPQPAFEVTQLMPQTIPATDPRFSWQGAISTNANRGAVSAWRIPYKDRDLFDSELNIRAEMPAGVRIAFRTNSSSVSGEINPLPERSPIDLVVDGTLTATAETDNLSAFRFSGLGNESKNVELWLPQFGAIEIQQLEFDDDSEVTIPAESTSKKWITYGSSITQARLANSPTKTWPAIVARTRGYDLTCLGYGGQCHLDPMIARIIRDREADLISLCLGINIFGAGSLNQRTFYPGILGFVQIVREKHPTTPLVLISPIYFHNSETVPNNVGFTLVDMRAEVKRAYETLKNHGDQNVYYVDGLDVFGPENAHLLPDDLHPNNEGYGVMANNLLNLLPRI